MRSRNEYRKQLDAVAHYMQKFKVSVAQVKKICFARHQFRVRE